MISLPDIIDSVVSTRDVSGALQLETISTIVQNITGDRPIISRFPDHVKVSFSPAQQIKLRDAFEKILSDPPGAIRIDSGPVVYPVILKRLVPALLISFGIGFLLGR